MRALRVVGITEGGGELSVVLEDSARQERFTVPADEQLRAAARGDLTRLGQIAIELESQLRPREIQARIRAGASVDQVAAAAGVPSQKIERFAYPVLLERSRTAEVAQRAHPMRADGPDTRMLADVVAHTFGLRGQEYRLRRVGLVEGRRRALGRRAVVARGALGQPRALDVPARGARRHRHGDRRARARPGRRPARAAAAHRGPGDRHLPAGRAAAARPRGGARAARGRVGHRGAPGRLRLVARGARAAPPGAAAPGRAARARRRPSRPGSGRRARHRMARSPAAVRVGADRRSRQPPRGAGHVRRRSSDGRLGLPRQATRPANEPAAGRTADRNGGPPCAPRVRSPPMRRRPSLPRPRARRPQAEAAVPSARSPSRSGGEPDETAAPPSDGGPVPTEPPAPRQAEPEARRRSRRPKRGRKGKPVMPSWDEVLLGVRSQR